MSIITQDFVAAGKPFYIVANAGVKYTDITDGMLYQQTTIPYGKNWKLISNQNVFIPLGSGVTTVTASTPLQSSGGDTPNISIPQAGPSSNGYLSAADWNTFNSGTGGVPSTRTIGTTAPLQGGGDLSANRTFSITQAGSLTDGYLSAADWGMFNSRFPYPTGTSAQYIRGDGSLATFPTVPTVTPAALTKTDDTNVTLTLTGTPTTALLQAVNIAVGWSGTLADGRIASASTWNSKVSSVTATGLLTSSGGTTPDISSQVNKGKLIGRNDVTDGVMEEITVGSGLSLSGTTLSNTAAFTTPLTTKGDIYTRDASADTRLPVGLDTQILVADSSTTTGLKWTAQPAATPTGYYGAFQDNVTQTAVASNVGYAMILRTVDLSNGISVVTNGTDLTRITFANTGIYNLQFSSQFQNVDNTEHDVTIWLRLNGTDVAGSSGFVQVPKRRTAGAGNEGHVVVSWNYVLSVVAGQYYELMWSTTNHTNVTMQFYAGGSPPPSSASVILTVTQQSGIMAGTGITAINSLTGAAQTLAAGTSGTDFAISSAGTAHTFNLPTASATNRGALSSTDWNTFNGKTTSPWQYRISGRFYTPSTNALSIGSLPNVSGSIRYSPVIIERDITITQLGISVVTIAAVGNTARVGIYTNNPATNQPLTRLVDSGTIALDGAANSQRIVTGLSITLTKGLYWFAYFSNASTGTIASIANLNLPDVLGTGTAGTLNNGLVTGYFQTLTYTNLPATASGLGTISSGASSYCIYYYY